MSRFQRLRAARLHGGSRSDVRNSSFAIVIDPRGAAIALQRYPF